MILPMVLLQRKGIRYFALSWKSIPILLLLAVPQRIQILCGSCSGGIFSLSKSKDLREEEDPSHAFAKIAAHSAPQKIQLVFTQKAHEKTQRK